MTDTQVEPGTCSSAARAASSVGSGERLAVPLMGFASSVRPRPPLKNRSGDEQHTCSSEYLSAQHFSIPE